MTVPCGGERGIRRSGLSWGHAILFNHLQPEEYIVGREYEGEMFFILMDGEPRNQSRKDGNEGFPKLDPFFQDAEPPVGIEPSVVGLIGKVIEGFESKMMPMGWILPGIETRKMGGPDLYEGSVPRDPVDLFDRPDHIVKMLKDMMAVDQVELIVRGRPGKDVQIVNEVRLGSRIHIDPDGIILLPLAAPDIQNLHTPPPTIRREVGALPPLCQKCSIENLELIQHRFQAVLLLHQPSASTAQADRCLLLS